MPPYCLPKQRRSRSNLVSSCPSKHPTNSPPKKLQSRLAGTHLITQTSNPQPTTISSTNHRHSWPHRPPPSPCPELCFASLSGLSKLLWITTTLYSARLDPLLLDTFCHHQLPLSSLRASGPSPSFEKEVCCAICPIAPFVLNSVRLALPIQLVWPLSCDLLQPELVEWRALLVHIWDDSVARQSSKILPRPLVVASVLLSGPPFLQTFFFTFQPLAHDMTYQSIPMTS